MAPKLKICGITHREDAVWALNDGAQFLGVDFRKKSPRRVLEAEGKDWIPAMPTFASRVAATRRRRALQSAARSEVESWIS